MALKKLFHNPRVRVSETLRHLALSLLVILLPARVYAIAELELVQTPLFLGASTPPNMMVTFDDSGSMKWEFMLTHPQTTLLTDSPTYPSFELLFPRNSTTPVPGQDGGVMDYVMRSAQNNSVYYDPDYNYEPWINADGVTSMPDASPSSARYDPTDSFDTLNLLSRRRVSAQWFYQRVGFGSQTIMTYYWNHGCYGVSYSQGVTSEGVYLCASTNRRFTPITYFEYKGVGIEDRCVNTSSTSVSENGVTLLCNCNVTDRNDVSEFRVDQPRACAANYVKTQIWQRPNGSYRISHGSVDAGIVDVSSPDSYVITSVNGVSQTVSEIVQNYANWFQYYRTRALTAKAGTGFAFAQVDENQRIGWGSINTYSSYTESHGGVRTPLTSSTVRQGIEYFSSSHRQSFFNDIYNLVISGGTPSRRAVDDVGQYFSKSQAIWNSSSPLSDAQNNDLECRTNFHLLISDGYWNSEAATTVAAQSDVDSQNYQIAFNDGVTRTFTAPYPDNYSNTLADAAFYYWSRDLNPNLENEYKGSAESSSWQRLTTFALGFGLQGSGLVNIPADGGVPANNALNWGDPALKEEYRIDDMWHAAINTGGLFLEVNNTEQFVDGINRVFDTVAALSNVSAAGISSNQGSTSAGSLVFQSRFDSGLWLGQIAAYRFKTNGQLDTANPMWIAGYDDIDSGMPAKPLPTGSLRKAMTYNSVADRGISFKWQDMDVSQQRRLLGLDDNDIPSAADGNVLINSLLGASANDRNRQLGDIIDSSPTYVGRSVFLYPNIWGDKLYSANSMPENGSNTHSNFRLRSLSRRPMIYVGANDGMLHGFVAEKPRTGSDDNLQGTEVLAYFPDALFNKLRLLNSENYQHQFYVNGTPTQGDAYFLSSWHTVLVGGLNGGGQGVYALDVTTAPTNDTDLQRQTRVLWEFSELNDGDMGYSFSEPNIVRLHNGRWAAIFGNGYNSIEGKPSSGQACNESGQTYSCDGDPVLFVIDIQTGDVIAKLEPEAVALSRYDATLYPDLGNGLSDVSPVDVDGDYIVDFVYGGDLQGNLWRYNLTASNPSQWSGQVIFQARDENNLPQAITVRPQIGPHPKGINYDHPQRKATKGGVLIYVGTGKLLENKDIFTPQDNSDYPLESFYGIWDNFDRAQPVITKSSLLEQRIFGEKIETFSRIDGSTEKYEVRAITDYDIDWSLHKGWYMNLVVDNSPNSGINPSLKLGERLVAEPLLHNGRVIFNTYTKSGSDCGFGGSSWLMELDAVNGGRLYTSPLDFNGDSIFNRGDYLDVSSFSGNDTPNQNSQVAGGYKKSTVTLGRPAILSQPSVTSGETKVDSAADGQILRSMDESTGERVNGRQSWREIRSDM